VGRARARVELLKSGSWRPEPELDDLNREGVSTGRVDRESLLSGFDEGFQLDLAVDDFDDVLDIAAILLLL
jgi:hypothetical protein